MSEDAGRGETYTAVDLARTLRELGVGQGDCVFVHSALRRLGTFKVSAAETLADALSSMLEAFLQVVSAEGTLVVPTFDFGFCKGREYDVQNTPSEGMGAFAEHVRRNGKAVRSRHPFQSVAAIGRDAGVIADAAGRTAFSAGGSFDRMLALKCKIVFLGVGFVETFVHVAEERAQVSYRFWKSFKGYVIDNGARELREIDFFARRLDQVPEPEIDNDKLERHFLRNGMKRVRLGAGHASVLAANELVNNLLGQFRADDEFALVERAG